MQITRTERKQTQIFIGFLSLLTVIFIGFLSLPLLVLSCNEYTPIQAPLIQTTLRSGTDNKTLALVAGVDFYFEFALSTPPAAALVTTLSPPPFSLSDFLKLAFDEKSCEDRLDGLDKLSPETLRNVRSRLHRMKLFRMLKKLFRDQHRKQA